MTEERDKKRSDIYNLVLIQAQLMPFLYPTYGSFMDEFEKVMKEELGECSEDDMNWCVERLDWFVKRNAEPKRKGKKENKP